MYAMDASEAFGSWCVKGAGPFTSPVWRSRRERWSDRERERMTHHYYYLPLGELLEFLWYIQDPREQRVIQYVYEKRRALGHG